MVKEYPSIEFVEEFQEYCNRNFRGYLKYWKATSMLNTLSYDILREAMFKDHHRLLSWVQNCLEMEGFSELACHSISNWIIANWSEQ